MRGETRPSDENIIRVANEIFDRLSEPSTAATSESVRRPWYDMFLSLFRLILWPFKRILAKLIIPAAYEEDQTQQAVNLYDQLLECDTEEKRKKLITNSYLPWSIKVVLLSNPSDDLIKEFRDTFMRVSFDRRLSAPVKLKTYGSEFRVQRIDYSVPADIMGTHKCSMLTAVNSASAELPQNRSLVIVFGGNGMQPSDMMGAMEESSKRIENDVLIPGYPKGATSTRVLVDAGVIAVRQALAAGYPPDKISFSGHSLGGAVATLVLERLKTELPDTKFNSLVIHRSFSSIGAAVNGLTGIPSSVANAVSNLLGLGMDPARAIEAGLPIQQIKVYRDKNDGIVSESASIATAVAKMDNHHVPTAVKTTPDTEHNGPFANSMFKKPKGHKKWSPERDARKIQANKKYTEIVRIDETTASGRGL